MAPSEVTNNPSGDLGTAGIQPLFVVGATQEMFEIVTDQHVTAENPWKLLNKQKILDDISFRGVISDWQKHKNLIKDFPGDEVMVVYDAAGLYDGNFYLVTTKERFDAEMKRRDLFLNPPTVDPTVGDDSAISQAPQRPRGWTSLGSEVEIVEERIANERPRLVVQVSRQRRFFNRQKEPYDDRDALDDFTEFRPFKDPNFELRRRELDVGIQAVAPLQDTAAQTYFQRKVPASSQVSEDLMVRVEPNHWLFASAQQSAAEAETSKDARASRQNARDEFAAFLKTTVATVESALRFNETLDLLQDDFVHLEDEDVPTSKRGEVGLKEHQSYTHIEYSKGKRLNNVQWHPSLRGIIGVSVGSAELFDTRVNSYGFVQPSHLLLWSFADPIVPKCALLAPSDVTTFKFNPSYPSLVAAGCSNGRVCVWDIVHVNVHQSKALHVPFAILSSIEGSHFGAVADLTWFPAPDSSTQSGDTSLPAVAASNSQVGYQFATCGYDCTLLIWEAIVRPGAVSTGDEMSLGAGNLMLGAMSGAGERGRKKNADDDLLDPTWLPIVKINLTPIERSGRLTPLQMCLDMHPFVPSAASAETVPAKVREAFGMSENYCRSWCGTEEGELVHLNWSLTLQTQQSSQSEETGTAVVASGNRKQRKDCVDRVIRPHVAPLLCVVRSPFFEDLLLTVGDWKWCLFYKDELIFSSPNSPSMLSAGAFSHHRPGVLFTATVDGKVEVWDLLDRTHEAMFSQSIVPGRVTSLAFPSGTVSLRGSYLACGDDTGTLRVLDIPRTFAKKIAKEDQLMLAFLERELSRAKYVQQRTEIRTAEFERLEKEKASAEAQSASSQDAQGGLSQTSHPAPEVVDAIVKQLEDGYKQLESEFLQMLKGGN